MAEAECKIGDILLTVHMTSAEANAFGAFLDKFNRAEIEAFCEIQTDYAPDPVLINTIFNAMFEAMRLAR